MSLLLLGLLATTPGGDPNRISPVREADVAAISITVTASREPIVTDLSGVALSIVDAPVIEALRLPLVADYLRLTPSVAIASSGGLGSQTQVRIRGAEANHSLIFVDGIKLNDPASSGEFRLETLLANGVDRIEVLRGPQSALWGAEAIGGVINVLTRLPTSGAEFYGQAEAGSFGRVSGGFGGGVGAPDGSRAIAIQAVHSSEQGIDTSASGGDRDGYRNTTASGQATLKPTSNTRLGLVVRHSQSRNSFDDFDFSAGSSLDAPFATVVDATALRVTAGIDTFKRRWSHNLGIGWTDTANRNRTAGLFTNRSDGSRLSVDYQTSVEFDTGSLNHRVTAAAEYERQRFRSRDADPLALSNQQRSRRKTSAVGEYRLEIDTRFAAGFSMRHDDSNRFRNATTARAIAAAALDNGLRLHGSFGEGVADPTFFDLYGFFPDFFVGNPGLKTERSRGYDIGMGWERPGALKLDLTWHQARLSDEIVGTFDPETFLSGVSNAVGRSRRRGVEVMGEAALTARWRLLATYAWLDAGERQAPDDVRLREVRRPRHSGSLTTTYSSGPLSVAGSVAYVGRRIDTDFSTFSRIALGSYALVTLSTAYELFPGLELTGRIENAGDARYEDVVGYRTPGIGLFGGLRFRL